MYTDRELFNKKDNGVPNWKVGWSHPVLVKMGSCWLQRPILSFGVFYLIIAKIHGWQEGVKCIFVNNPSFTNVDCSLSEHGVKIGLLTYYPRIAIRPLI